MEGFHTHHEQPSNAESLKDWRALKEEAPKKAALILKERGLQSDIAHATTQEAERLCVELPRIIEEFSYNENGLVQNENRYIVGALARILRAVHKRNEYEAALLDAA